MDCRKNNFLALMQGGSHFVVPCYQRPYSWSEEQCSDLFEDLLKQLTAQPQLQLEQVGPHFMGSIGVQAVAYSSTGAINYGSLQPGLLIIDGQQRLTTMYLLYLALAAEARRRLETSSDSAEKTACAELIPSLEAILFAASASKLESLRQPRFDLTELDQAALKMLLGSEPKLNQDSRLASNYQYFCDRLEEVSDLPRLFAATGTLEFIELSLEAADDPQLIFESLNSKGMVLSVGDKVRNFLLMGFNQCDIQSLYQQFWLNLEGNCGHSLDQLTEFIQYYLAIKSKSGRAPSIKAMYAEFKRLVTEQQQQGSSLCAIKERVLKELHTYSQLFKVINDNDGVSSYVLGDEADLTPKARIELQYELNHCLQRMERLDYSVRIPLVMQCLMLHHTGRIDGAELLSVLKLIETFLFRRWVCNIPSNGLNRIFQSLSAKLSSESFKGDKGELRAPLEAELCAGARKRNSMPKDDAFAQALQQEALYSRAHGVDLVFYMLERLETEGNREQVDVNELFSIEHIMPQTLNDAWREQLGPDADKIHKTWLHRLGNLTLTAYNSTYSNSPFAQKRDMEKGFKSSRLWLNHYVAGCEHWGEEQMSERSQNLVAKALEVWPYPEGAQLQQQSALNQDESQQPLETFDYCLAEGVQDLNGTKLNGYEFMGQHSDAKNWAQMQREVYPIAYQINPERLRSWLKEKWGNFNFVAKYIKSVPQQGIVNINPDFVIKLDEGVYFHIYQNVNNKLKFLVQFFELMELDPKQLTLHLVRRGGTAKIGTEANEAKLDEAELFDFCLNDGEAELSGTKPVGFELNGAHYDVKSWAKLSRIVVTNVYHSDPERLRKWQGQSNDAFNIVKKTFTDTPDDPRFQGTPSAMVKLADDFYFYIKPSVPEIIKQLVQLFAGLELDPKQLVIHLRDTAKRAASDDFEEVEAEVEHESEEL